MRNIATLYISVLIAFWSLLGLTGCATWKTTTTPAVSQPLATLIAHRQAGQPESGYPYPDHSESFYYQIYADQGVTVVSWNDIRWAQNWSSALQELAEELHARDIYVVYSLSNLTEYLSGAEPDHLTSSRVQDPWGNPFTYFRDGEEKFHHSLLHPDWQNQLLSDIREAIDAGADGILVDELAYGSLHYPDFTAVTLNRFSDYLREYYRTTEALRQRINQDLDDAISRGNFTGCFRQDPESELEGFDYARFVRQFLCNRNSLTQQDWSNWAVTSQIPLFKDFQRFLRLQHREMAVQFIQDSKAYADANHRRRLSFSANINTLHSPEAPLILELLEIGDHVELEWFYKKYNYFPAARASSSIKLAQAFGRGAHVLTSVDTRRDLFGWNPGMPCDEQRARNGRDQSTTLYRTMIADAHAAGGTFALEEGVHCVLQDLANMKSYYRFPSDYPRAFHTLIPVKAQIGVLLPFESLMRADPHDSPDYRGLANLLADGGNQFDVIFAAEDFQSWGRISEYPAPSNHPLTLERLQKYPVIIVPELADITEKHAATLLQYLESGGDLVIFITQKRLENIVAHAQHGDKDPQGNPVRREKVLELVEHLKVARVSVQEVGSGRLFASDSLWGSQYLEAIDPAIRADMQALLADFGIGAEVEYTGARSVGAYAYTALRPAFLGPIPKLWFKRKYLVAHLVNYDYDKNTDVTTPVEDLSLTLDLGDMFAGAENLSAFYYWPGFESGPSSVSVEETNGRRTVSLVLPRIDVWAAIVIDR